MVPRILLLSTAILLSGCATTKDVIPIGNGNYEIAGSSVTALSSGGAEKVKLMRVASQYCTGFGKQMVLVGSRATDGQVGDSAFVESSDGVGSAVHAGTRATADVIFHCE